MPFGTTTSVVVPVFKEDADVLERLRRLALPKVRVMGDLPSLVLAPRPQPLAEVAKQVPQGFGPVAAGQPLLVRSHLEVPAGATLVIDGQTPDVALSAARTGFATIMSRGRLTITGTAQVPVTVASRGADGNPDADVTDGRRSCWSSCPTTPQPVSPGVRGGSRRTERSGCSTTRQEQQLGGTGVTIGASGYRDVDGSYADRFGNLGATVVLVRPDSQVYGASADATRADELVPDLGTQLPLRVTPPRNRRWPRSSAA